VAILELLTPPPKPKAAAGRQANPQAASSSSARPVAETDPQAELVSRYRRKLSMALN
jgi:putative thioredoxin